MTGLDAPLIGSRERRDPSRERTDAFRVALVSMPFSVKADRPSLQISLLRALAERAGFTADSHHLYLDLAAAMGPQLYDRLCDLRFHLTGEWLFSVAAFGDDAPADDEAYFTAFPGEREWAEQKLGRDAAYLSTLRREVLPAFIETCLDGVDWGGYQVVGFSSVFQQQAASLALARRIKQRYPAVRIVFGGANLEGEMGLEHARAFPFIDYVVVGEGDVLFPALLQSLAAGEEPNGLPGLLRRTKEGVGGGGRAPDVRDLDDLPTPNYDEFFERSRRLGLLLENSAPTGLTFESSRGCWWGQKQHCTFCGLNGLGMAYRAKNTGRLLAELADLSSRYGGNAFEATDAILGVDHIRQMFGALREANTDYQFFYEVKANLTREQLRTLYLGGLRAMQPGIESLSTHVLQLMRKGCTMLQNVRMLKWARYYGITAYWNLLWGFPGETEEDYRRELEVLKQLSHLEPPQNANRIWLERFAPYYEQRERFGVQGVEPRASYRFVYPEHVALDRIAYLFEYRMPDTLPETAHRATYDWTEEWYRRWSSDRPDQLLYRRTPDALLIEDSRGRELPERHVAEGPWAEIYDFCSDTMRTAAQVTAHLFQTPAGMWSSGFPVVAALDEFCRLGLMLEEDGQYLSLALPVD
jgi:ribosomal peptide maturation radical SAM protein 1